MASQENELREQLDRLEGLGNTWLKGLSRNDRSSNAIITINAGGIGIWIVSCFAAFMTGCTIFMAVTVVGQQHQIDRMNDYLNAIYQIAPNLKPKDK
jgi:hypothetical protein